MPERFKFTHARLEKLACPPNPKDPAAHNRVYVYDDVQPGLCLAVTTTGSKTFYVLKKLNGRVERIKLESFPAVTVDQARDLARETIGKIAGGQNPADQRRIARGEQTFGDVFTRYIEDYAKPRKRTWEEDQDQYDRHLTRFQSRKLSAIKLRDVQRLHTDIGATRKSAKGKETPGSPYAANRLLALISKVYSFARTIGYEGTNPAKGIQRFREDSRERFIQPDEMPRFLAALDDHNDPAMADLFRLLLFTGARRSNVQGMAWADVNFSRRVWNVPGEQSKNGTPLQVWLSDPAIEVLQRRWKERTLDAVYVFPSHGKTGHITEPKFAWAEVLKAAEITDLRIHDLRRTAGSWMAMNGASLPMIGKALGHKSQQTTQIYARLNLDPVAVAMGAATDAMLGNKPKPKRRKGGVAA